MANARQGEIEVEIDRRKLVLRYSLKAMAELRDKMGVRSLKELAERFRSMDLDDLGAFFDVGVRFAADRNGRPAEGTVPTLDDLQDMMTIDQLPAYTDALRRLFNAGATGKADVAPQEAQQRGGGAPPRSTAQDPTKAGQPS